MDAITSGILVFQGIIFLAVIVALIYLVVKRIDDRGKETFEKRDN